MMEITLTEENISEILTHLDTVMKSINSSDKADSAEFLVYQGKLDAYNRVIGMGTQFTKKIVYDIPSGRHVLDSRSCNA